MIKIKGIESAIKEIKAKSKIEIELKKNLMIQKLVSDLKDATPVDTGNARDGWMAKNNSIVNDVEYIDRLNEGTSEQAPAYFVESTLLANPGILPNGIIVTKR